jgi:hypothetical protein
MGLHFITTDAERWGTGLGRPLTREELDDIVWTLKSAVEAAAAAGPVSIEAIRVVSGVNLYVDLTNGSTLGPFTLPVATLSGKGLWAASTAYSQNDVVSRGNTAYLVVYSHVSGSIFSEGATDAEGRLVYAKLIEIASELPAGGNQGMVLVKASNATGDFKWAFQIGLIPPGGTAGQIPVKASASYADIGWSSSISLPSYGQDDVSGAVALDFGNGECQRINLVGNVTTLEIDNFGIAGRTSKLSLEIWGGDAFSLSWPEGWLWEGGILPTLGEKALIVLVTLDGGVTIYANVVGQNYKIAGA